MGSQVQSYLAPLATPNSFDFNNASVSSSNKAIDRDAQPQVEFHTMLQNSNADLARERAAKKNGDLSSAKTDEEFRKMLAEKANPKRTPKNSLGKDDFMKLFIAQMQSQDPLNPQDSTQMAAQMAQFNGLEQMMNVNKTLETMLQSQNTDRAVGMVNYVGKEVDVATGLLKWNKDKLTKSTFEVEQPLANAFVEVRDSSGQIVSQQDMGNIMPGEHNLKWNGKLKDGSPANPGIYHFSIIGKSVEGQDVPIPIKSKVKITGVDLKTPGGAFFTELGKLEVKDVSSVGLQGFEEAKPAVTSVPAIKDGQTLENQFTSSSSTNAPGADISDNKFTEAAGEKMPPAFGDKVTSPMAAPGGAIPTRSNAGSATTGQPEVEDASQTSAAANPGNLNIPVTFAGR